MMEILGSAVLLALAWFVALNLLMSAVAWAMAVPILASRFRERNGLLLSIRLLPSVASALFVLVVFVPSHMRFERANPQESFGVMVWVLAFAGAALLARSAWRAAAAIRAGQALVRRPESVPGVSLVGVWRPRVLVGAAVASELTSEELDVALAHEDAHRLARDNFKQFLMAFAPDFFGRSAAAARVEGAWRTAVETLADARAVKGSERRAVHLASALVKVARCTCDVSPAVSPVWSHLHEPPLLELRVRRLVAGPPLDAPAPRFTRLLLLCAAGLTGLLAASAVFALQIHQLTEALVSKLP
jgi:hypothetical protein